MRQRVWKLSFNEKCQIRRALELIEALQIHEARTLLKQCSRPGEWHPIRLAALALAFAKEGDFAKALSCASLAYAWKRHFCFHQLQLWMEHRAGFTDHALEDLRLLLEQRRRHWRYYYLFALFAHHLGYVDEAKRCVIDALKSHPNRTLIEREIENDETLRDLLKTYRRRTI